MQVLTKAEVDCRSDCTFGSVNIDDFQRTSFGNATGSVEANSEEGAIAMSLQTLVKQQFDFRLGEDFRLSVAFYFHAWCIPDPMLQSLAYLLHCCICLTNFLTWRLGERGQEEEGALADSIRDNLYQVF